jgi:SAM-dependent methyltransferase
LFGALALSIHHGKKDKANMSKIYNNDFFLFHKENSFQAAKLIVPIILDTFVINSVVDVGCGNGSWLRVFLDHGINNICGYDISDLEQEAYLVNKKFIKTNNNFTSIDFSIKGKYDLLICLEVVEHLPRKISKNFIKKISNVSPLILFSAAIPGQKGTGHVNEQVPSYWRRLFNDNDFVEIDFLKPLLWKNAKIAWWYRQNITMYISKPYLDSSVKLKELANLYPQLNENENLVLISERILQKHNFSITRKIINYFKRNKWKI